MRVLKIGAVLLVLSFLSACNTFGKYKTDNFSEVKKSAELSKDVKSVVNKHLNRDLPPIEYRSSGKTGYFILSKKEDPTSGFPDLKLEGVFSVSNTNVYDTLNTLFLGTGIGLSMSKDSANKTGLYVISEKDVSLKGMVDKIVSAAGLFYEFKDNTVYVKNTESYVFKTPPMLSEEASTGIQKSLEAQGATQVAVDTQFNIVSFNAGQESIQKIKTYLKHINESLSVIVYDTWIWEVSLFEEHSSGVRWEEFIWDNEVNKVSLNGSGGASFDNGFLNSGVAGGISYTTKSLSLTSLVRFLQKYGSLSTLSNPKISLLSGSTGVFSAGEKIKYVSELTSTVSTTGETTQSSAQTETLSTGLKMTVKGAYEGSSVFSQFKIETIDLVNFNDFAASGTTLALPRTIDRLAETESRIVPGEYFILGGINMVRNQYSQEGVPLPKNYNLPYTKAKEDEKTELVMVIKPRVILFKEESEIPNINTPKQAKLAVNKE